MMQSRYWIHRQTVTPKYLLTRFVSTTQIHVKVRGGENLFKHGWKIFGVIFIWIQCTRTDCNKYQNKSRETQFFIPWNMGSLNFDPHVNFNSKSGFRRVQRVDVQFFIWIKCLQTDIRIFCKLKMSYHEISTKSISWNIAKFN